MIVAKKKAAKKKSPKKKPSSIEASSEARGTQILPSDIPSVANPAALDEPFRPTGPMKTGGPDTPVVSGVLPGEIGDYVESLVDLGDGSARRRFVLGLEMNGIEVWQLVGGSDPHETITVFKARGQRANLLNHMEVCEKQWPIALDAHPTEAQLEQLYIVLRYWTRQVGLG